MCFVVFYVFLIVLCCSHFFSQTSSMAPKRKLGVTLSEAIEPIRTEDSSLRTKQRKLRATQNQYYHVPANRRSAKFAIAQWDRDHHYALSYSLWLFPFPRSLMTLEDFRGPAGASWRPSWQIWGFVGVSWVPRGASWGLLGVYWKSFGALRRVASDLLRATGCSLQVSLDAWGHFWGNLGGYRLRMWASFIIALRLQIV